MPSIPSLPPTPRITPGTFVRLRRTALGLTLEHVAMMLETTPGVSTQRRAEWLRAIEQDVLPISLPTAWALHDVIGLDLRGLSYWMAIAEGVKPEQIDAAIAAVRAGTSVVEVDIIGSGHAG